MEQKLFRKKIKQNNLLDGRENADAVGREEGCLSAAGVEGRLQPLRWGGRKERLRTATSWPWPKAASSTGRLSKKSTQLKLRLHMSFGIYIGQYCVAPNASQKKMRLRNTD
jgi:hypothetical protein